MLLLIQECFYQANKVNKQKLRALRAKLKASAGHGPYVVHVSNRNSIELDNVCLACIQLGFLSGPFKWLLNQSLFGKEKISLKNILANVLEFSFRRRKSRSRQTSFAVFHIVELRTKTCRWFGSKFLQLYCQVIYYYSGLPVLHFQRLTLLTANTGSILSICLHAAFTQADPKRAKSSLTWLSFCAFWICFHKSCT